MPVLRTRKQYYIEKLSGNRSGERITRSGDSYVNRRREMMKGIRGLLEKDFRLFLRQGGNLFLVLAVVAIFFILTGKMGADFIAVYIPSVMAVYSGNTISYDENGHGYTYLFSLPVNKKNICQRKNIFYLLLMTVCGWMHWGNLCRNSHAYKS